MHPNGKRHILRNDRRLLRYSITRTRSIYSFGDSTRDTYFTAAAASSWFKRLYIFVNDSEDW